MSRRIAIPLVVLAMLVVATVLGEHARLSSPRSQVPSRGLRTPGPTAVEEAGVTPEVSPPTGSSPRRAAKPPRVRPPRRSTRAAGPKASPPSASRVAPGAGGPPPVDSAAPVGRPNAAAMGQASHTSSEASAPLSEAEATKTAPAAEPPQTDQSARPGQSLSAPELRPPVLLSEIREGYPPEGYLVVLDRGSLGPRLRVEAAEGRTILKVLVRMDGSVGDVVVLTSSGYPVLDRAASDAARSWRFRPATRDGEPVDAWAVIPVRFVAP